MSQWKSVVGLFLCVVFFLSLTACNGQDKGPTTETISYNLEQEPESLDPQIADDYASRIVIMALFEGLVRLDADGNPTAGVASSWKANSDNTSFTFHLRQEARWPSWTDKEDNKQEERPVTARDFIYGFQRALDPATSSPTAGELYPIKNAERVNRGQASVEELGVSAPDDYTLVVELEYPYEDFPTLMALPAAMPCNQKFFEQSGGQYGLEVTSILGNGPYQFSNRYSWEHSKSIALVRSSSYQGEEKPIPAGINFSIGQDVTDAVSAIENGTVDAAPLPGDQVETGEQEGLHLTSFEDTTWGLCFNTQDSVFSNLNIRKSFVQSLDREYVLSKLPDNYSIANDIIVPDTSLGGQNYRSLAGGDFYLKADANSRVLLNTGLQELQMDRLPSVRVLCLDDPQVTSLINNMLELWFRELGYYINMEPLSRSELSQRVKSGNYQIALAPIRAENDGPMEILSLFSSDNPDNPVGLQSAEFDGYLSQAEDRPLNEGVEYYVQAEQYLNNQAVFYPLCYEKRFFAAAANVEGIIFHSYDSGVDFLHASKVTE